MKHAFFFLIMVAFAISVSLTSCAKDDELALSRDGATIDKIVIASAKEPVQRAYRDSFDTWYNFVPDIANGWNPSYGPFLAWYPGGGEGNATHMGKASTYFNQYVPFTPPNFASVPAPVTMFFNPELTAAGYPGIPLNVQSITFDTKGNSVWFWGDGNTVSTPVSPTRIEFTGTSSIVGGTGKFAGATGQVTINGYFNPQNQQDASVWSNGLIVY
jgi:hypothetical protein